MAPKPPLDLAQLKLLRDDSDLLHLLFHRNKNQHRLLKWWQWFGTMRRNLNKLLTEHDLITAAKTTPNRDAAVARYRERVAFMRKVVVPAAYTAFGSVIAMRNFAPLGMVLTGVLARVWKMIRPSEEELEREREAAAAAAAVVDRGVDLDVELGVVISREAYGGSGVDDEAGVVVSRAEYEMVTVKDVGRGEGTHAGRIYSVEDRGERSKKKKKKKKPEDGLHRPTKRAGKVSSDELEVPLPVAEVAKATKEKRGMPRVESPASGSQPKRKLDAEPARKKKKKRKADDIDNLFSGLF